jgi:hypothetical protein
MKHLIEFKLFESEESKEEIVKQASKYKSLVDLRRRDTQLYYKVVNNNLTNSAFPRDSKWTKEKIEEEAEKYNNKSEFGRNSPGAYNRAVGLGILDELFPKIKNKKKSD